MRYGALILAACLVLWTLGATGANAAPYLSGSLGVVIPEDSDLNDGFDTGSIAYDSGPCLALALGTASGYGSRFELELAYRSNDFDTWTIDGSGVFDVPGDVSSLSLMGNGFIDFAAGGGFSPFIGAGLGFANLEATVDLPGFGSEDDTVFAYQLAVGGSFATYTNLNFDIQYRYFGTADPNFAGLESEYQTHNVMVGLRSAF